MAITPGAGYIVDPSNPNAVIKADSLAMPGSVAAIQQSNQQPSIAYGAVNTSPIPVSTVTSNQTPISVKNPNADYFNGVGSSAVAGASVPPPVVPESTKTTTPAPELSSFQNLLTKYLPSNFSLTAPTSTVSEYQKLQAENDIAGKTKEVNDLSAQLAEIKTKYDLTQPVLEKNAIGRGITTDILNRQVAQRQRDYAIEALPVTAALNAAQGRLDSANKNIQTLIGLVQTDQENTYKYQSDLLSRAMEFASNDQKVELQKRQDFLDAQRANQTQFNDIKSGYIDAAIKAGDYATAGKLALANTPEELNRLASGIKTSIAQDTEVVEVGNRKLLINSKTGETVRDLGASSSSSGGLTPTQINSTVNSIAGAFDNEPIVKSYNTVQEGFQTINTIGTKTSSPADDIAFIYAFAKIMDPNSVVREGEYNTIQKYAQTWADNFGFSAKRIFSNTNFLTPDAKQKMLNALQPKVSTITSQYLNLKNEYQRQIDDAYSGKPRQITSYENTPGVKTETKTPINSIDEWLNSF